GIAVAVKTPHLAAKLQGMFPAGMAQGIGENGGVIAAPLWEAVRPSKVQVDVAETRLWQPDRRGDSDIHSEIRRIQGRIRREIDADAVIAEPDFVHGIGRENVSFIDRHDLAMALARIAETGNIVALQRGLLAKVRLKREIPVDAIALADRMADIGGSLVDIDTCGRGA